MTLKIISAENVLFEGEVTAAHFPGLMGRFTVLKNHATMVAALEQGVISYDSPEGTGEMPVSGGLVDIDHNILSVCVY